MKWAKGMRDLGGLGILTLPAGGGHMGQCICQNQTAPGAGSTLTFTENRKGAVTLAGTCAIHTTGN